MFMKKIKNIRMDDIMSKFKGLVIFCLVVTFFIVSEEYGVEIDMRIKLISLLILNAILLITTKKAGD